MIAGSSIGAWVGGHYALYKDIDKLEEFTSERRMEKVFSFMELSFGRGIVKGTKLRKLLNEWLKRASFKDLQIRFRAVATDLYTGKQVIFKDGNLAFALRASMSLPAVLEPVPYGKYLLSDGGLSNPVPDDVVRTMGADVVLSVNLNELNTPKGPKAEAGHKRYHATIDRYPAVPFNKTFPPGFRYHTRTSSRDVQLAGLFYAGRRRSIS